MTRETPPPGAEELEYIAKQVKDFIQKWLDIAIVCVLAQDCEPGFVKKNAILIMTTDFRHQIGTTVTFYIFLETLLRVLQMLTVLTWARRNGPREFFDGVSCITVMATFKQIIDYAIEFNNTPSLVVDRDTQLSMSTVIGVLAGAIVISFRFIIHKCAGVVGQDDEQIMD